MKNFLYFIKYYKKHKKIFLFDLFWAFIVAVIDILVPLLISFLINQIFVLPNFDWPIGIRYCVILFVFFIVRAFGSYFIWGYGHAMGSEIESEMRFDLFAHLERLSFSYFDNNQIGKLSNTIVNDLFEIAEVAHHVPEDILLSVFKLIGTFFILFRMNKIISAVLLCFTVVLLLYTYFENRSIEKVFAENRKAIASVNSLIIDSLSGIRVVQAFANEDIELEKFKHENQIFLQSKKNNYFTVARFASISRFLEGVLYVSVFATASVLISKKMADPKDMILYVLYINMFLVPLSRLVDLSEMLQKGVTGFKRMMNILEIEPDIQSKNGHMPAHFEGNISFDQVCFAYEQEPVLENISLNIPSGQNVALVGPSGVGKSTFCSLIPRFYDVTKGSLKIDGIDVKEYDLKYLRKQIGIVQQDVYLFHASIRENIAYGKESATMEEIIEAAKKANIHDFIMSLEDQYDTLVGERGVRFSGGEKQRISIARVFLKNPKILILDEATSSLDNESEKFIKDSLEELIKGRTTLSIAHRLSTIQHADCILVLDQKNIAEKGTHEELLKKKGLYQKLHDVYQINE